MNGLNREDLFEPQRSQRTQRGHRGLSSSAARAVMLVVALGASSAAQDDGHDLLRSGKYQEAISLLSKVPASDSDWMDAQKDLARAYATIGKYDEAENVGRRAAAAKNGVAMWNTFGEVLLLRGRRAAAESAFVRAAEIGRAHV